MLYFVILSSFGAGNMFQSNQMAAIINTSTGTPEWISGLIFAGLAFVVLIGGIKRIANVTEKLVPLMVVLYVGELCLSFFLTLQIFQQCFALIIDSAFSGTAAQGAFAGVVVREVIVSRYKTCNILK